jgi:hypothetical protein
MSDETPHPFFPGPHPSPRHLPPYPQSILAGTGLTISRERSPEAYVKAILSLPVDDPRYIRDIHGTKCNFFVRDVLELLGIHTPPLLANDLLADMREGKYGFQKMLIQDALINAAAGCPTVAGLEDHPHGHVVMVLPTATTILRHDVMVAQAGAVNFYGKPMAYSWARPQLAEVAFFGAP